MSGVAYTPTERTCDGCGEDTINPWSYCNSCAACLLDLQRPPRYRLNPPEVLDAQVEKMRAYEISKG